jgi:hypothetical protein
MKQASSGSPTGMETIGLEVTMVFGEVDGLTENQRGYEEPQREEIELKATP